MIAWNSIQITVLNDDGVAVQDEYKYSMKVEQRMIIYGGEPGPQGPAGPQGPQGPAGPSGSGAWGTITGDINSQTDLKNALDGKSDTNHNHNSTYYTKTQIDNKLATKASAGDLAYYLEIYRWSPEFSTSTSYAVGDYTIRMEKLYRFINAHTGAWSANDVTEVTISDELKRKANAADLGALASKDTVDYSTEVTNKPTLGTIAAANYTISTTDISVGDPLPTGDLYFVYEA